MAALESCPKHNMISRLERLKGIVEFMKVNDFLQRILFLMRSLLVSISEASIRTDLLFDDADGIDTLPNQAIFDAIQLMGYEGDLTVLTFNKALFSPQLRLRRKVHLSSTPCFKAYQKRISKEQRQQRKSSSKKQRVQKESVSKQGRKSAKGDGKAKEHAKSKGRTRKMMDEYKKFEDGVSTDGQRVSTDFEKVSTDKPKLSTDDLKVSTDEQMESNDDQVDASEEIFEGTEDQREGTEEKVESTAEQKESTEEQTKGEIATQASQTSTQTPTSMIFGDEENKLLHFLINMSKGQSYLQRKKKSVELKDVEDTDRLGLHLQDQHSHLKPLTSKN
ncbi:hypothetical protein Tco_0603480 [Tanacetum coccineum]